MERKLTKVVDGTEITLSGKMCSCGTDVANDLCSWECPDTYGYTKVENCVNKGSISGIIYTGGIVGFAISTEIVSCTNNGSVDNPANLEENTSCGIAGIVGVGDTVKITECKNNGDIGLNVSKCQTAAGIISICLGDSYITECENYGEICCDGYGNYAGGIVANAIGATYNGDFEGTKSGIIKITECINYGEVSAIECAGGIAGIIRYTDKQHVSYVGGCENNGVIRADNNAGGISGWCVIVNVENCINTGSVIADLDAASICGMAELCTFNNVYNTGTVINSNGIVTTMINDYDYTNKITNAEESHTHSYDVEADVYPAGWYKIVPDGKMPSDGKIHYVCRCGHDIGTVETIKGIKEISLSQHSIEYKGKEIALPSVIVKDADGNAVDQEYYTVTWVNSSGKTITAINAVGEYVAKVTFSGHYTGVETLRLTVTEEPTTTVEPKTTEKNSEEVTSANVKVKKSKVLKTVRTGKKKAKITFKKVAGASSYQIQISVSKKFKAKSTKIIKAKKTTKIIKKLKAGKKYYVRVRAVKKMNGVSYKGKWSKAKIIKAVIKNK